MVDIETATDSGAHAVLVTPDGQIILQQRDDNPQVVNHGLLSTWGGSLRSGELPTDGLHRELIEELELDTTNYPITELGDFRKTLTTDGQDYLAHVFVVSQVEINDLTIHEGKGYLCNYPEELLKSDKLTRITRLILQRYLDSKTSAN